MNTDYIKNYIELINETLDVYVSVEIKEAILQRYALYGYCIGNIVFCWDELFEALGEYHKKLHIIHAYTMILDAEISRRGTINSNKESVQLLIAPNKLAKIICKLMDVSFLSFEELQREMHSIKAQVFPFPDPKGTYFKIVDEIRSGITKFKVCDIYADNNKVMVTARSISSYDNMSRIITLPEIEMMQYYRIINPAEFIE